MPNISSFGALQTSLSGLLAHQRQLDVASHNIANADTVGYTRQAVNTTATPGIAIGGASNGATNWLGQGVTVESYQRLRNDFLDVSARTQNMLLGERGAKAEGLSRADAAMGEPSDTGINAKLNELWTSFKTLANTPNDPGARAQVIASAQSLASSLKNVDANLGQIASDAMSEFNALTTGPGNEIGGYASELAQLNDAIGQATAAGQQPNDMLDRRDLILDKLSSLAQVSVTNEGYGRISVKFGDAATPLVNGSTPTSVATWPQTLTNPGGQLGGLLGVQASVAGYRTQLDNVAGQLAASVNAIHGTPPFFSGNTAATLTVNVTASTLQAGSGTGNQSNNIAAALTALRGGTADATYQGLVTTIGAETSAATAQRDLSISLVNDVESRRQSVAGVSLDEEMTNLIKFQRGYQASARAMSTVDEMLDVLINRTGRVGL
ncbi:MAG: flagellar hook-associated protein FlgK [Solirubrobacteraceae bacterium]|nr:flagellar hook-associated protein FlgK [Solirubrobacteraceae bacterium]